MTYAGQYTEDEQYEYLRTVANNGQGRMASSWDPVDISPILSGEHIQAQPAAGLCRTDGLQLLYPGKEHTVIGEMESGKSWLMAACCAHELVEGHTVVYIHYEEADATDTIGRLIALGVGAYLIPDRFMFVGPDEPLPKGGLGRYLEAEPSLVVNDGVNEAMSLHGWGIRDEDGAALYRRRLVKPFTAVGAAVLSGDHVVKDREKRGRDPLGSIHKGNGLTAALIYLENADPFGRGIRGRSHVYVTKDRPGYLRRHGKATKLPGKTFMGELVIDDTKQYVDHLDLTFFAPKTDTAEPPPRSRRDDDEDHVLETVAGIILNGKVANLNAIRGVATISYERTDDALVRLTQRAALVETPGPNRARIFNIP